MGSSPNCVGARGLSAQNDLMFENKRGIVNGVLGEGPILGSSVANDLRINQVGGGGANQVPSDQQKLRKIIHWEKFFPSGSLKVLLVENDDSTRHVLSALIRNCSYEVIAVADGFHAWKILEDETNHIDLVLTEVVMPFLSGVGLLSKIMSHQSFKNIPVIMMSSHDSMGIVFKCLSKGAADFLVKPIRKNELKNLWQHVWRRCRSSCGSVNESGTQTKRSIKSNTSDDFEDDTGSSVEREIESIGFSVQDGSDAQSPCPKKASEVDSSHAKSFDQLADTPDSTCAQVLHTNPEILSRRWLCDTEAEVVQEKDKELDKVSLGKELKIGVSRKLDFHQIEELSSHPAKKSLHNMLEKVDGVSDIPSGIERKGFDSRDLPPSLELSLKRLRDGDLEFKAVDERNVLRRSNMSAFSRYTTGPSTNQSNGSTMNNFLASSDKHVMPKLEDFNNKLEPLSTLKHCQSTAFLPVKNTTVCSPEQVKSEKGNDVSVSVVQNPPQSSPEKVQVQHHHHHYHLYHHHVYDAQKQDNDHLHADALHCESSYAIGGEPIMNGSVSGSNTGSNGNKGSSAGVNGVTKTDNGNVVAENRKEGGVSKKVGENGGNEDRLAHRKAALTKFRQKRNERCFEKKVRYQNRKTMAEQRPRIRGQFVRKNGV